MTPEPTTTPIAVDAAGVARLLPSSRIIGEIKARESMEATACV